MNECVGCLDHLRLYLYRSRTAAMTTLYYVLFYVLDHDITSQGASQAAQPPVHRKNNTKPTIMRQ